MIISFATEELKECCCSAAVAEKHLGSVHAQALATLIADAEAIENADEWLDILMGDANINDDDSVSISIGTEYIALFVVAGTKFHRASDQRILWDSVKRLKLMNIKRRS